MKTPAEPDQHDRAELRVAHAAHDQLDAVGEVGHRLDRDRGRREPRDQVVVRRPRRVPVGEAEDDPAALGLVQPAQSP